MSIEKIKLRWIYVLC